METSITNKIPAGLIDRNIEFFQVEGKIKYLQAGEIHDFDNLTIDELALIREDMETRPSIIDSLEQMGIFVPIQQIKQFIICNYGGFDQRADLTSEGINYKEYWDCGHRGKCQFEGRLCSFVKAPNGYLTRREIEVIKLIGEDLPDKLIADRMGISIDTIHTHRANIEHKIGAHSKVGIALFAKDNNII